MPVMGTFHSQIPPLFVIPELNREQEYSFMVWIQIEMKNVMFTYENLDTDDEF